MIKIFYTLLLLQIILASCNSKRDLNELNNLKFIDKKEEVYDSIQSLIGYSKGLTTQIVWHMRGSEFYFPIGNSSGFNHYDINYCIEQDTFTITSFNRAESIKILIYAKFLNKNGIESLYEDGMGYLFAYKQYTNNPTAYFNWSRQILILKDENDTSLIMRKKYTVIDRYKSLLLVKPNR